MAADEIEQHTAEQMEEMRRAVLTLSEFYNLTFSTPTGLKVLEHLTDMTCGSSLNSNDMMDANASVQAAEFVFIREGQNNVLRYIKRMIAFYKEQK